MQIKPHLFKEEDEGYEQIWCQAMIKCNASRNICLSYRLMRWYLKELLKANRYSIQSSILEKQAFKSCIKLGMFLLSTASQGRYKW